MAVINITPLTDITALIASDSVNPGDVLLLEEGIYSQTVIIQKNDIRIVAKGPGVIFDGKSTLASAFSLSNVTGVLIEGINIKHYRLYGILISEGSGNRIVKNTIRNTLSNAIEVRQSSGNLLWKNEMCRCFDGIRLINGSTNNWVIENLAEDCLDDGFESFLAADSNNAFILNKAIRCYSNGLDLFGSNNLALDNLLIDNSLGLVNSNGSDSVAIRNEIRGCKTRTQDILANYINQFSAENHIVCNIRAGINNNGWFGTFLNNEISYNGDTGITLGASSNANLLMENNIVCNFPVNIADFGTSNILIKNKDKACEPCESPGTVCRDCVDESDKERK